MTKWTKSLLGVLALSLLGNAYLFYMVISWQEAWVEQILTTSEIERLYRMSSEDISIEGVMALALKEGVEVKLASIEESDNLWLEGEKKALLLNETKLFFINGQYIGSKANLPPNIWYWGFGQE